MSIRPRLTGAALLLTGLLSAGVCAPVCAQGISPVSSPGVSAAQPGGAVPWSSMSPAQQRLLSRLSGQWERLTPQRQQALASGSKRWLGMSPNQRVQARQRFNKWQKLPAQRRRTLRQRWEEFRALPPAQQRADRENFRKFKSLPQPRRQQLRQRWQSATPAERQDMVDQARERRAQRAPKRR